jgi:predicted N-formylglutamate amidohydrolase
MTAADLPAVTVDPASLTGVVELSWVRGAGAAEADAARAAGAAADDTAAVDGAALADAVPDLLIEIPHGATRTVDFTQLAARLLSPLPADLVDFFHVNTDAGAPELALATARALVAAQPQRRVAIARCRIPRTFIDCNRRIDASPEELRAGKVTPGLMPWITEPADRDLLRDLYDRYVAAVAALAARLPAQGAMLLLHTYAPRSVDVQVDLDIVPSLRRAYQPAIEPTWPLRPEVDVIGRGTDGTDYTPPAVMAALRHHLGAAGVEVADGATYPLHPSTLAFAHVMARPGRALCVEVRRDLLADPFEPFAEMRIAAAKAERLAAPLAAALAAWW